MSLLKSYCHQPKSYNPRSDCYRGEHTDQKYKYI